MNFALFRNVAAAALALTAMPAIAATQVTIRALPGTANPYSFDFVIPTGATPNFTTTTTARFNGVPFTYTRPNGTVLTENGRFDGPTFFTTLDQGGIAMLRLDREPVQFQQFRLFGQQLFTGPTTAPVFRFGTFDLASTPRNGGDPVQPLTYRVTIGAPVPEPATWAMMIAGFGAVGVALRRRRRRTAAVA
jgi:hypothetical protein